MPKRRTTENKRCHLNEGKKTSIGKNIDHFDGLKNIKNLGAGDSYYIANFIKSKQEKDELFSSLLKEVEFEQMFNFTPNRKNKKVEPIPRLVTAQTNKDNKICNKYPIYRMPGCNERNIATNNWTKTVEYIRSKASDFLQTQQLNHCVVTLYRDENDSLGFHKDKLLDLKPNSLILSISFGSPRPILFYPSKKKKHQHRQSLILQPGSLLAIGPLTNKLYKHSIPKLKESVGPRISLSMRSIDTFVTKKNDNHDSDHDEKCQIVGRGKEYQDLNWPFAKNYNNINEYDDETIEQIAKHKKTANENLKIMQKEVEDRNMESVNADTADIQHMRCQDIIN